ncbi:hypothetical protein SCOR_04015 [Sulfidibacter corallicola]|uniref:Uncharacterized protein n=1 Tax=Sulfidibacter corallicola TaxID=2818388 RepID=A0A8A4TQ02_SULCO|nr:hypothetical protein [Sulfidibacter corallicola]QTD52056.1 hypothetical protein J3U87_06245 [Sulfidibacter corallicola]
MFHKLFADKEDATFYYERELFNGVAYQSRSGKISPYIVEGGQIVSAYNSPCFTKNDTESGVDVTLFFEENDWQASQFVIEGVPYQGKGYWFCNQSCVGEILFDEDGYVSNYVFRDLDGNLLDCHIHKDQLVQTYELFRKNKWKRVNIKTETETKFGLTLRECGHLVSLTLNCDIDDFFNKHQDFFIFPEVISLEFALNFHPGDFLSLSGKMIDRKKIKKMLDNWNFSKVDELYLSNIDIPHELLIYFCESGVKKLTIEDNSFNKDEVLSEISPRFPHVEFAFIRQ